MVASTADTQEILMEIRNVDKAFGGVKAVDDVSMDLRAGIITTLVGPNGAGKTTLFNLITGELLKDSGSIKWLGNPINKIKPYQAARAGILRTFQDLRLFNEMSVEDNILTSVEDNSVPVPLTKSQRTARREKVEYALNRAGLFTKRKIRAKDLAYAERKFLSMARVMATDARLWLLDEPASGLDPNSYEKFLEILREEVKQGVTVCIIEHNLDIVIGISDRIAFLDRGKLLADGEPQSVLNDPELRAIYFGERT
ncbi:ABC transporter ATP-binding protein [Sneathiella sp. HT1-7]|jgi:ABC-type branched-subunit amino acid transport system ATPase component|uniref:ABC transporter ATP-binding protein n=1 Tax=Sneathiella sp. HT1-7 TaxID=2887192 RepID=UPI001D15957B|nr:ATP-binding cassette domain-containing protein [Sneathiella sp. HT1-7]MCC3306322.1 ATP-binding cassette domain-containing protein [Sneathiella sp. HT1-7]